MAQVDLIQPSFSTGELSPKMLGRVDFPKYLAGAEKLTRFMPLPHGGITKTPGTKYQAPTKFANKDTRLIRFVFSSVQAYQLEFGDQYIRIHISEGLVESSPGVAYEVVTPYLEADLRNIQFAQSADVLFLVCKGYPPKVLSRTGLTSWTFGDYAFEDGPYLDINITATTLTPSAVSGSVNITASSIVGINNGTGFQTTDVGRWIRIRHSATVGWAKVTSITSTTVVVATVSSNFGAATASANWNLGAWTSVLGYPETIAFYEDRLFFGGSTSAPQRLWGTVSGDYYTHSPTESNGVVADDNAVVYELASGEVNNIRWLEASKALIAGTASGEFVISGGGNDSALTPTNVRAYQATVRGSAKILPIRIDSVLLFVQKAKTKLREHSYDFGSDSFQAIDLTILSEHLGRPGMREIAYQQEPYSVIWVNNQDGSLNTLTYNREQEVVAWAPQPLPGAEVRSVSVIPSPTESEDEVFIITRRTINEVAVQYVEKFTKQFEPADETDKDTAFFVDCGLIYDGASTSTITGLSHLEGEEVSIWGNGAVQPRRTVTGGQITLQTPVTYAVIGLPYLSYLKSIRYEGGSNRGTTQGKKKRIASLTIRFLNTLGVKFGRPGATLEDMYFRAGSDAMDDSPPLFTGDKKVTFPGDYDLDGQVVVSSEDPTPVTILALMPEVTVNT